jgi:catechol 2,3-dioxygenase-like lactoylglutathione lyase family enzyme
MVVEDMDRSVDFYTRVLDFKKTDDQELFGEHHEAFTGLFGVRVRIVRLRLGNETIELTQYLTPRGRLIPRDSRSNDRWFQHIAIVTTDMNGAYARLRHNKVGYASTAPQTLPLSNPNAGGISAFYFRDPDDHVLEIIHYPAGKGDPRWQEATALFAGIDHTAIVVSDTDKSIEFYRDRFCFSVAGTSENVGTEQAHLNNVRDAHLRITALRAPGGGIGVELLQYLTPTDGRTYPQDSKPNDLWHWTIHLVPVVDGQTQVVRDPDGHAIVVDERDLRPVAASANP